MAQSGGQNEPSMEDILASIRRIITEDEKAQHTRPAAAPRPVPEPVGEEDEEDILDLTERVESAEEVPTVEASAASLTDAAQQSTEAEEQLSEAKQSNAAAEQAASDSGVAAGTREGLVSAQTAAAAVAALSEVSRNLGNDNAKSQAGPAMEGQTLDALVRQALTPLLQAWLDENLPALVEDVVREEVQRLVIESRRR
ncbi:DUF2497 domain-containing protein [Aquibaculum arenosum]|uniref:DUF2497 domain-containing protein n=1 Tax=Aquibaculum arenosum TaxID=3032591 RepID=A0ABT5YNZ7_9PROT|nr:DUF2497 domain-containing protein [Fodinicurvata sp. CAU 1616]MDF2096692.1 DUF2497 domain-containing protein [Fodinicurvata sp. CAU 1616]